MVHSLALAAKEAQLFFKRALKNPKQLGAVLPSSRFLGALMAQHANIDPSLPIIELGGGTGSLTQSLLDAGVSPQRLYVIELDEELYQYLKKKFPQVNVILGNATELETILPDVVLGNVGTVISGLPMINIPQDVQKKIFTSCFRIMKTKGKILQYTYALHSPVNATQLSVYKNRIGTVFFNIPPATVWQYTQHPI